MCEQKEQKQTEIIGKTPFVKVFIHFGFLDQVASLSNARKRSNMLASGSNNGLFSQSVEKLKLFLFKKPQVKLRFLQWKLIKTSKAALKAN